jgi:hypothetical protein
LEKRLRPTVFVVEVRLGIELVSALALDEAFRSLVGTPVAGRPGVFACFD